MQLKIYAVHDSKVGAYLKPFTMRSNGEAIRAWTQTCNGNESQFSQTPADFTLVELGTYNEETGTIKPHADKIPLGTALDFRQAEPDIPHIPVSTTPPSPSVHG